MIYQDVINDSINCILLEGSFPGTFLDKSTPLTKWDFTFPDVSIAIVLHKSHRMPSPLSDKVLLCN